MKRRDRISSLLGTLTVLSISIIAGIIIILLTSDVPSESLFSFFISPFTSKYFFFNMLACATPLIFTGLAVSLAFSAGTYNLGVEGQVYLGALAGTFIAVRLGGAFPFGVVPLIFLTSFLVSGLLAGVSGWLKSSRGANELITSLLAGNAIIILIDYIVEGPFQDFYSGLAATPKVPDNYMLSKVMPPSDFHTGFFIGLFFAILIYWFIYHTRMGYDLRITGKDPEFARYLGIKIGSIYIISMFLSGGLAGIGGIVDVLGIQGRVIRGFSAGYGWNGIAVSLIARNNPLLVIPSALFFAYLDTGAQIASFQADLTPEVARVVQSVIFYFITARAFYEIYTVGREKK
ncbi:MULTISPECIES: ABC transporter permease [Kosmotoga]|uniref:Inner-membrane translocator n=1 Tax=Kosmotoga olearia (strain ATCC BAA-1733 / DSM 21960 / TBF 19.5.1) TaxID=521045 RepID=C5CGD6_KOSOT|nr:MULTISPECIES: ABC transporter permease [Kosmotoga]ACR80517.1 inner-membrane translocator [Kosmotoga olearia TBF 19.5.1]MDI3523352.1 riboflavin transport system permease protein [Kosmotoga sp.]MDK2953574.1 riboflavin transport system permease protein [Kosmotoga sp.]OAA19528.1 ABC transporter permease [Kosmotoga sp. DU53]